MAPSPESESPTTESNNGEPTDDDNNDDRNDAKNDSRNYATNHQPNKDKSDKINKVSTHEVEGINIRIPKSGYKRQQNRKSKQSITVVFNYSKVNLSEAMEEVLNLGLNFAILPKKSRNLRGYSHPF